MCVHEYIYSHIRICSCTDTWISIHIFAYTYKYMHTFVHAHLLLLTFISILAWLRQWADFSNDCVMHCNFCWKNGSYKAHLPPHLYYTTSHIHRLCSVLCLSAHLSFPVSRLLLSKRSRETSFSFLKIAQTPLQPSLAVSYTHSLPLSLSELSVFTELSVFSELSIFIIFHFGFGLNSDKMVAANVAPACRISTCVCVCVCMYVYACVRVCVGSRKCESVWVC